MPEIIPTKPLRPVRQKDIARRAGVTIAAVSLALRNSPEVSPALRRRVTTLARKMGYVPDPTLQALARYRKTVLPPSERSTIAFLYAADAEKPPRSWADTHLRRSLLECAEEYANRLGYHVEFINIGLTSAEQRRTSRILRARGLRGALLHCNPLKPDEVQTNFDNIAVVTLFNEQETPRFHTVGHNHFHGMETAIQQIALRGYVRPLAIINNDTIASRLWQGAFDNFCQHHPQFRPSLINVSSFWTNPLPLIRKHRADALIVSWDRNILRQLLTGCGLHVPQDIGYCILDTDQNAISGSGIFQRSSAVLSVGIDLLDRQLQRNEFGIQPNPLQIALNGYWVEGTSLRPGPKG